MIKIIITILAILTVTNAAVRYPRDVNEEVPVVVATETDQMTVEKPSEEPAIMEPSTTKTTPVTTTTVKPVEIKTTTVKLPPLAEAPKLDIEKVTKARTAKALGVAPAVVEILSSESDSNLDGSYSFSFESADGTYRSERAYVVNPGTEDEYIAREGMYRYISGNGDIVEVHYKADIHGFVPTGTYIRSASKVV